MKPSPVKWLAAAWVLAPMCAMASGTAGSLGPLINKALVKRDPIKAGKPPKESLSQYVRRTVLDRTQLAGFRRLGYHIIDINGDSEAFAIDNYGGQGDRRFTDQGTLSITANKVLDLISFTATVQDSRFRDPDNDRFRLEYDRGPLLVAYGDLRGNLTNSNTYASLNRTLRGVEVGFTKGNFRLQALQSQARGQARTISFNGNNSPGPYFLNATQIVRGSETVRVDGIVQAPGLDYTLTPEAGILEFQRSISPSSTVVVTFEIYGANAQTGSVAGAGLTYDMKKSGRIGFTAIQQKAGSASSVGTQRTELFQGFGPAGTPYTLQFTPWPSRPITIRVDGVVQVLGVDYTFDTSIPSVFYFNRFIPSTSEVSVLYTPLPTTTTDGDRTVWGLDYRLPLGKRGANGMWTTEFASGRMESPLDPLSGLARSTTVLWQDGPVTLNGRLKSVDPGFTSVETRTFNRNEKSVDVRAEIAPNSAYRYGVNHSNSLIAVRRRDNNGNLITSPARSTNVGSFYELLPEGPGTPIRMEWQRSRARLTGNDSSVDTIRASTGDMTRGTEWRIGAVRQTGRAPVSSSSGAARQSFTVNGIEARATRQEGDRWTLDAQSSITSADAGGERGTGTRLDLSTTYSIPKLAISASWSDANSGGVTSLGGFTDGSSIGLGESGFTNTGGIVQLESTRQQRLALNAAYFPFDGLSVRGAAYRYSQSGQISSNSETTGFSVGIDSLIKDHRIFVSADLSSTKFLDSPFTSEATTLSLNADGPLLRKMRYSFRASQLVTGGTSQFRQNGGFIEGSLVYDLTDRIAFIADASRGNSSGYLAQEDRSFGLSASYRIWENLRFNAGYRYRSVTNLDPGQTSGAYRFNGLDFELTFSF